MSLSSSDIINGSRFKLMRGDLQFEVDSLWINSLVARLLKGDDVLLHIKMPNGKAVGQVGSN